MELKTSDIVWIDNIVKAFNRAKFDDIKGMECVALTQALQKLFEVKKALEKEKQAEPPLPEPIPIKKPVSLDSSDKKKKK